MIQLREEIRALILRRLLRFLEEYMAFSRASRGLASLIERDGYGGRGVSSTFPECVELGFAFES